MEEVQQLHEDHKALMKAAGFNTTSVAGVLTFSVNSQNSSRDLLDVGVGVPLRKDIRVFLPEDVADSAAGEDLQAAATLPHPERDLCTHG